MSPKETKLCKRCGKPFRRNGMKAGQLYHPRCSYAVWKDNLRSRNTIEMREWKKAVRLLKPNICASCGSEKTDLEVDHIKPFSTHPELRYDVANGQLLCGSCHKRKTKIDLKLRGGGK